MPIPNKIRPNYKPLNIQEDDSDDDDHDELESEFEDDNDLELTELSSRQVAEEFVDDEDEEEPNNYRRTRHSLETLEGHLLWNSWNRWEEPCLLSILVTGILVLPTLGLWMYGSYVFAGRLWAMWIFVLHLHLRFSTASWYIESMTIINFEKRKSLRLVCSVVTCLECLLCGFVYPLVGNVLVENFFRDMDGTFVLEWVGAVRFLRTAMFLGWIIVGLRILVGLGSLSIRFLKTWWNPSENREWRPTFWTPRGLEAMGDTTRYRLQLTFTVIKRLVLGLNIFCILSAISHFGPWPMSLQIYSSPSACDPLDNTECALPFPSFHHMTRDSSTKTGWRVHLKGLPPLRGGIPFHPTFLNDLDGFSTMAPILFYLEGMKEAHEQGKNNRVQLQGHQTMELSVTASSATLLLNVDIGKLVHHTAEIDYLDPNNPLVMVIPSQPLHHATHYALALVNAVDKDGNILPPTAGMRDLWTQMNSERRSRYVDTVVPALQKAAPWVNFAADFPSIQLLFDFMTVSEESQIGTLRKVRDITLSEVHNWDWNNHIEIVSDIRQDCSTETQNHAKPRIARTINVNIDVPWFMKKPNSRYSTLDHDAIQRGKFVSVGKAKGMIKVPCSLERATLGKENGQLLKAVMEYGHGLFADRGEANDEFLSIMANNNGYVQIAMDWRGMSVYDLPIVIKTLIGDPNLFQAVRDNLIQGYANKIAFQHFARNGMLDDWLRFDGILLPTWKKKQPASVFYGISQGGILGAGYMSLIAKSDLIERAILGVPGTPFALVMTRSLDFAGYDQLMLLNFYNNRHVRILLSLVQMGWDSVEASGLLAPPVSEKIPRILLQAGLGDPVVPTIAAEALARAMRGSMLESNPHEVFGISVEPAANDTYLGPHVTLTELLYESEFYSLPLDDVPPLHNAVHYCVRKDKKLIKQIVEFTNTGRVIDPCQDDQCRRASAKC